MTGLKIKPCLPEEIGGNGIEYAFTNRHMSQKIDGHRLLISTGNGVVGYNKRGEECEVPRLLLERFAPVKTQWTFDGESLDGEYHAFDIIETPDGEITSWPWTERQKLLNSLLKNRIEGIHVVAQFTDYDVKAELFKRFKDMGLEGVVFSSPGAAYSQKFGKYKYKFVKQIDCIVIGQGYNDKDNFILGVYDNGEMKEIGKVSSLTGDGPKIKVGDVIQINLLYVTPSLRVYQPVKPRLRYDVKPEECTLDQLIPLIRSKTIYEPDH